MIEGKILQDYINIQFSILYTDLHGNRIFKIITYSQKLSHSKSDILAQVHYGNINQSYLWAIIYNVSIYYIYRWI